MVITFESVDEILLCDIQMKAIEQYRAFYVVLYMFITLCEVVLTFESVDQLLSCDHSLSNL